MKVTVHAHAGEGLVQVDVVQIGKGGPTVVSSIIIKPTYLADFDLSKNQRLYIKEKKE